MNRRKLTLMILPMLVQGGCMFRQAGINQKMEQQLATDRADVKSSEQEVHASVLESGRLSDETRTATHNRDRAQRQLEIDQRQFDNYKSASGQSHEPRE